MYICLCNGVTENQIRACAQEGACTLRDLEHCLGVGAGCGRCTQAAAEVLHAHWQHAAKPIAAAAASA